MFSRHPLLMPKIISGLLLACALTACGLPQMSPEAKLAFEGKSEAEFLPELSGKTIVAAFRNTCEANLGDLRKAISSLSQQGYILFATQEEITIYAHPDGKPLFSLAGDDPNTPELCTVLYRETPDASKAITAHVRARGGTAPAFDLPLPGAIKIWEAKDRLYILTTQHTAQTGQMTGLAVGKS